MLTTHVSDAHLAPLVPVLLTGNSNMAEDLPRIACASCLRLFAPSVHVRHELMCLSKVNGAISKVDIAGADLSTSREDPISESGSFRRNSWNSRRPTNISALSGRQVDKSKNVHDIAETSSTTLLTVEALPVTSKPETILSPRELNLLKKEENSVVIDKSVNQISAATTHEPLPCALPSLEPPCPVGVTEAVFRKLLRRASEFGSPSAADIAAALLVCQNHAGKAIAFLKDSASLAETARKADAKKFGSVQIPTITTDSPPFLYQSKNPGAVHSPRALPQRRFDAMRAQGTAIAFQSSAESKAAQEDIFSKAIPSTETSNASMTELHAGADEDRPMVTSDLISTDLIENAEIVADTSNYVAKVAAEHIHDISVSVDLNPFPMADLLSMSSNAPPQVSMLEPPTPLAVPPAAGTADHETSDSEDSSDSFFGPPAVVHADVDVLNNAEVSTVNAVEKDEDFIEEVGMDHGDPPVVHPLSNASEVAQWILSIDACLSAYADTVRPLCSTLSLVFIY